LRGYHYTAIDPFEHLLMGPVSAIAGVLDQTGLGLRDMGAIEMHEAFAAQVLGNLHGLASAKYCQEKLGRSTAVGEVDPEFVNQWGGSISLGHPFGATGGRLRAAAARPAGWQGRAVRAHRSRPARPAGWARRWCSSGCEHWDVDRRA
jgi:acetyl-CoA acyltransferase